MGKWGIFGNLLLAAAIGLSGCGMGERKPENMYVEKTDTSVYSQVIEGKEHQGLYRYEVDESIRTIHMSAYELEDGAWRNRRGQSSYIPLEDALEIAIGYQNMMEDLTMSDGATGQYGFTAEEDNDLYHHVSWREGWVEIVSEEEIPLTMQIVDEEETLTMPSLDAFFTPEKLTEEGFDKVFVVTVRFSENSLDQKDAVSEEETLAK